MASISLSVLMTVAHPTKVLGVSGSLRRASYNTELLRVAAEVAPEDMTIVIADISDLPLYNYDIEREGFPRAVRRFRDEIEWADALLFATPEYNYSVTGVMKNAIDWASTRPSPLDDKPAAIMGTGGRSGTARAQNHLRDILQHNRLRVVAKPEVVLPRARMLLQSGTLQDSSARDKIRRLLESLQHLIRQTQT